MKMKALLAGLGGLALTVSLAAAPAQAATSTQSVATTAQVSSTYKFCNPVNKRHYCSPSKQWKPYIDSAYDWSRSHTSKDERKPVPYPAQLSYLAHNGPAFVYLISYRPTGFIGPIAPERTIWKFGETGVSNWALRASVSLAECEVSPRRSCKATLVAVTDPYTYHSGKWWARYVEASGVKKYQRSVGVCPPGQRRSCR